MLSSRRLTKFYLSFEFDCNSDDYVLPDLYYYNGVVSPRDSFRKDSKLNFDVDIDEEWEEVLDTKISCISFFGQKFK